MNKLYFWFVVISCSFVNLSASDGTSRFYYPLECQWKFNLLNDELIRILEIRRKARTDELRFHVDMSKDLLDQLAALNYYNEENSLKAAKIKMRRYNLDLKIVELINKEQKEELR